MGWIRKLHQGKDLAVCSWLAEVQETNLDGTLPQARHRGPLGTSEALAGFLTPLLRGRFRWLRFSGRFGRQVQLCA